MDFVEFYTRESEYWYEVDNNAGRSAHLLYAEGGKFVIGEKVLSGRAEIAGFYSWREGLGPRTARHVMTNPRISAVTPMRAVFASILMIYADSGLPVLESRPAVMIADVATEYVRVGEAWELRSRELRPIFEGGVGAMKPG